MVKGYSGVFRLGEATSTWDADSPVCILTSLQCSAEHSSIQGLQMDVHYCMEFGEATKYQLIMFTINYASV